MNRKLIRLSPSTSVVSLPSAWVRKNKLKKGATLSVAETDNNIIVSVVAARTDSEISLDISKLEGRLMWIAIDAAYVAGYDSIILKTRDPAQSAFMTKVVRYFPGMMIYSERRDVVHFKSMAEHPDADLDKILNRIFHLNVAMLEDGAEAMKKKDWKSLSHMKHRDYTINSYISYCLRHISKRGYSPFSKSGAIHSYIKIMEMLSDAFAALFIKISAEEADLSRKGSVQKIVDIYKKAYRLHSKFSQERMIELDSLRLDLGKLRSKHPEIDHHIKRIAELFFDLEEMELQLNT